MNIGQRIKVLNDNLKTQYGVAQGDVGDVTNAVSDTHVEVRFNPDGGQPFLINMSLDDVADISFVAEVKTPEIETVDQSEVQN